MTVLLTDLPAGHTFDTMPFVVDAAKSRAYREATGDALSLYDDEGVVPPLAVAALALGALLQVVQLPPGTLHANESLQAHAAVPVGVTVECRARLAQRSLRGGYVWSSIESEIMLEGSVAITTRATVLSPVNAS